MLLLAPLLLPPPKPNPHLLLNPKPNPNPSSPPRTSARRLRCRARRPWFSNAEPGEEARGDGEEARRRRWWSDEGEREEEEEEFDYDDDAFGGADLFEAPWERIWILKVFKSFGYLLPFFFLSMVLATGPKAFLMAMALPLGQSVISLVLDALREKDRDRRTTRPRARSQPFAESDGDFTGQTQEESNGAYKRRQSYQSWVSADANVTDDGNPRRGTAFGGWDELDKERGSSDGYRRRSAPKMDGSNMGSPAKRMSKMGKYKEVPLFMRLLVAVFPFLGSWFRIL